jgi:hypothetical protein
MSKPVHSPWGAVQHADEMAPGVWSVSTSRHGGIKLEPKINSQVPDYMRRPGGWYEEDVDWSHVATVFPQYFNQTQRRDAEHIFMDFRPDMYEKFYKVKLEEGASRVRDEKAFYERNKNNLIVTSAFGDGHPQVPEGYVGVYASRGGRRDPDAEGGYFLVPAEEYARKPWTGFVVYPAKHQEVEGFEPFGQGG